jgi:hypothetical protein
VYSVFKPPLLGFRGWKLMHHRMSWAHEKSTSQGAFVKGKSRLQLDQTAAQETGGNGTQQASVVVARDLSWRVITQE